MDKTKTVTVNPYNSNLKWSGAAKVDKYYVAFVRASADRAAPIQPTVCTVVQTSQSGSDASRLSDVFIEQQSAVHGIRELVQQYASVFPEDVPAGLPPDRGISHAIPLQARRTGCLYLKGRRCSHRSSSSWRRAGSDHLLPLMVAPSSSYERKMEVCGCVLTIVQ